jgi:hypothetical protein
MYLSEIFMGSIVCDFQHCATMECMTLVWFVVKLVWGKTEKTSLSKCVDFLLGNLSK